jgi:hypothetical protein
MGSPVVRWQIITPRPKAAADFYRQLFDWETTRDNMLGYEAVDTGSEAGIHGGIWPAPPQAQPFVQLFMEVDDCAAAAARAVGLGAKMLIPPQQLPDGDTMAILHDPDGMSFGLVASRPV